MPVVPLGIESRCIFHIINDGYDTLKLKNKVLEELGQIDIKCNFPEGLVMSATQNKLKVEVVFSSKKSTSFTTKIEFKDNNSNSYTIPVSGTADNCILTNFPFMQKNKGGYIFKVEGEKSSIQIVEEKEDLDEDESFDMNDKKNNQRKKSIKGFTLGIVSVSRDILENNKEYIR